MKAGRLFSFPHCKDIHFLITLLVFYKNSALHIIFYYMTISYYKSPAAVSANNPTIELPTLGQSRGRQLHRTMEIQRLVAGLRVSEQGLDETCDIADLYDFDAGFGGNGVKLAVGTDEYFAESESSGFHHAPVRLRHGTDFAA